MDFYYASIRFISAYNVFAAYYYLVSSFFFFILLSYHFGFECGWLCRLTAKTYKKHLVSLFFVFIIISCSRKQFSFCFMRTAIQQGKKRMTWSCQCKKKDMLLSFSFQKVNKRISIEMNVEPLSIEITQIRHILQRVIKYGHSISFEILLIAQFFRLVQLKPASTIG